MRITGLHIDGFGRFADRGFGPLERPVTVFYGPNEAGKSTLLEFIRRILFGFPSGRNRGNEYPPLAGDTAGGLPSRRTPGKSSPLTALRGAATVPYLSPPTPARYLRLASCRDCWETIRRACSKASSRSRWTS